MERANFATSCLDSGEGVFKLIMRAGSMEMYTLLLKAGQASEDIFFTEPVYMVISCE
jgi:hypothetical protein